MLLRTGTVRAPAVAVSSMRPVLNGSKTRRIEAESLK